jgi:hypothetical protein
MELNNDEAAQWIQSDKTHNEFLKNIHKDATIKPRFFQVVIQFVLLTLQPENLTDLQEIEESNELEGGVIVKVRWIKPIAQCKSMQTCSHLIFSFTDANSANKSLVNGVFVYQKKVYTEKCKKELLRCLKCHSWNHLTTECSRTQDTCGTCMHQHQTSKCTNQEQPRCTPCNTDGHTSWDRNCPAFQSKCRELNERMEESQMPYYLTLEVWTQAKEPPKLNYTLQPPRLFRAEQNERVGNYMQTTQAAASCICASRAPRVSCCLLFFIFSLSCPFGSFFLDLGFWLLLLCAWTSWAYLGLPGPLVGTSFCFLGSFVCTRAYATIYGCGMLAMSCVWAFKPQLLLFLGRGRVNECY